MHEQTNPEIDTRRSRRVAADRATLFLSAIGSSVNADVHHRSASRLTVRRELQFLRVGADVVDDEGRHANIASVRVYVEKDIPTLIMELRYPTDRDRPERALPSSRAADGGSRSRGRGEGTVVFETEPDALPRIVSTPRTFVEELASSVRRLVGTLLRIARGVRMLASGITRA